MNQEGFFINCKSKNDMMLHFVVCQHPGDAEWLCDDDGYHSLTKKMKVCSNNREELEQWARDNSTAKLKSCSDCVPMSRDSGKSIMLPEEIPDYVAFKEGAVRQVLVNAYERNSVARSLCIAHYGTSCAVCGFNFGKMYGAIAEGYVHVHHLRQLSAIGAEYQIDPIKDLRPVCPNCHAVIHLRTPPLSIKEAKALRKKHT